LINMLDFDYQIYYNVVKKEGMKLKNLVCKNCGSNELLRKNGYMVCVYCDTKHVMSSDEVPKYSTIALDDDVARLLSKCKEEPWNAKKYANLVLDIDPDNEEALMYL